METTRERILGSAQAEFARHGIAGARVDRIARTARTSKERVYAYFRSKEELYAFVTQRELGLAAEAVPLDPSDLPGYAGALFDYFTTHPERLHFINWGRLEFDASTTTDPEPGSERATMPGPPLADPYAAAMIGKCEMLRQAQQSGQLDPTWDPVDVLTLINQIAHTGIGQPEVTALAQQAATDPSLAARRAAVTRAVGTLFSAPGSTTSST